MKLVGSTKSKITKNESDENVPNLEITEVVLVHCNIVNNNYQKKSKVLSPKNFIKTFDSEFSYIKSMVY